MVKEFLNLFGADVIVIPFKGIRRLTCFAKLAKVEWGTSHIHVGKRSGGWSILTILYGRWFTTQRMIAGKNPTISRQSTNSVIISRRF